MIAVSPSPTPFSHCLRKGGNDVPTRISQRHVILSAHCVGMQYFTAMNNQRTTRAPRGKGQPKAAPKRNANRRRRDDQDLSAAFSAQRVYGDIVNLSFTSDGNPFADAWEAFCVWLSTAAGARGSREYATLCVVRSMTIEAISNDGNSPVVLCPATSALGRGPAFRAVNRSRVRMSFAPDSLLVRACSDHFRRATNLPEVSPSWRREGIPLSILSTTLPEDILVASADSVFVFSMSVAFIRPDRVDHIQPVLLQMVPVDARNRAAVAAVTAILPAGTPGRREAIAAIQPGGPQAIGATPARDFVPRSPATGATRRRLFEPVELI